MIETLAGILKRSFNGDGIPAVTAGLHSPSGLAADNKGNLYVADQYNYRVRRISPDGIITTIAGSARLVPSVPANQTAESAVLPFEKLAVLQTQHLRYSREASPRSQGQGAWPSAGTAAQRGQPASARSGSQWVKAATAGSWIS